MSKKEIKWFTSGGDTKRRGPFETQEAAWRSMVLRGTSTHIHLPGTTVRREASCYGRWKKMTP